MNYFPNLDENCVILPKLLQPHRVMLRSRKFSEHKASSAGVEKKIQIYALIYAVGVCGDKISANTVI